jgi:hypothetical protein
VAHLTSSSPSTSISPSHLYLLAVLQGLHNGFVCRASQDPLQLSHLLSVSRVMPCKEMRTKEKEKQFKSIRERTGVVKKAGTGTGYLWVSAVNVRKVLQLIADDVSAPFPALYRESFHRPDA